MRITLDAPPGESIRIQELAQISNVRRYDRTSEERLRRLDENVPDLFSSLLTRVGYPDETEWIEKLSNSIRPIIFSQKQYYNELRPWELARKHRLYFDYDNIESAQTPSYPSGHTAQAHYVAGMLSRKYPELGRYFNRLANEIEHSRLVLGVHFPSDNIAGRQLASILLDRELVNRIPVRP